MLVNHDDALYDGMHRVRNPIEATLEPLPEQPQGEHGNDRLECRGQSIAVTCAIAMPSGESFTRRNGEEGDQPTSFTSGHRLRQMNPRCENWHTIKSTQV